MTIICGVNPANQRAGKIDLLDVTFTIPVRYDTLDRITVLTATLSYLTHNFDTNIIIAEEGSNRTLYPFISSFLNKSFRYCFIQSDSVLFHRTALLNIMARLSSTSCIVNHDADVILPQKQYLEAYNKISKKELDLCTPFNSHTLHVSKQLHFRIESEMNIDWLTPDLCLCPHRNEVAKGGVVFWEKDIFIKSGMENEHFISWGPEDKERVLRANKLGYRWGRVPGLIFHLEHERLKNSLNTHEYFERNNLELAKILRMSRKDLVEYISTWEWAHDKTEDVRN